jgi:hypothetical protein
MEYLSWQKYMRNEMTVKDILEERDDIITSIDNSLEEMAEVFKEYKNINSYDEGTNLIHVYNHDEAVDTDNHNHDEVVGTDADNHDEVIGTDNYNYDDEVVGTDNHNHDDEVIGTDNHNHDEVIDTNKKTKIRKDDNDYRYYIHKVLRKVCCLSIIL